MTGGATFQQILTNKINTACDNVEMADYKAAIWIYLYTSLQNQKQEKKLGGEVFAAPLFQI